MRLSEAVQLLARRLGGKPSRVSIIANRLQHAGRLPLADAKRTPPELSPDEFALLLIAVLAETGIGNAAERAVEYADVSSQEGFRLHDAVAAIIRGEAQPGDLIVREGGVTGTVGGVHTTFGNPAADGFARFATGPTLAAIAAEWGGMSPAQADAVAAINRIHNGNI